MKNTRALACDVAAVICLFGVLWICMAVTS